jgi:hypothetical protein
MLEDALLDLSNRSDIVVDPFLGSGSTLIAAEKTGRVCRGIELDPLYVDVIVRRYQTTTGNPAVLVETGEAFDLLAARTPKAIRNRARWARGKQQPWKRKFAARDFRPYASSYMSARSPEVRGSNPLSSTRKSAQIDVISSATE